MNAISRRARPVRFLIVDQDHRYAEWLRHHLGTLVADSAIELLASDAFDAACHTRIELDCDLLLLAAGFGSSPEDPHARGLHQLRQLRQRAVPMAVILIAEQGNELTAVRALQMGAYDYLPKRLLTRERLGTAVRIALRRLERRNARATSDSTAADTPLGVVTSVGIETVAEAAGLLDPFMALPGKPSAASEPARTEAERVSVARDAETGTEPSASAPAEPAAQASAAGEGATAPAAGADAAPVAVGQDEPATPQPEVADAAATVPRAFPPIGKQAPHRELDASGNFIPGYTILMTLGESEKAAVYLASSAALGRNVALKISKTLRDDTASRQFLEREYTAICELRHPSIVRIHDYGVHGGYEYIAMEYLPDGDLKLRIQQGVSESEALRYVELIAEALKVVHGAGLLHRDLKPPNVMLRESDGIALIDFGLARALDGGTRSTRTGVLRGSPYYMSPEQALGEALDTRSDLYSLGVILYEMLTGRKPYAGSSAMDVLQQHVNAPLPRLPRSHARYEPLLWRLLAKAPRDRFACADELLVALAELREPAAPAASSAA